jgi:DNA-binding response OmpR family regulator/putative methionine-R-sulfoxide reductase with GAF domain
MSGERILIIDDSREIVKHLTDHVLPAFGYETLYAYDGQTGLGQIRESRPDLVMLDFNLPEMTGLDVLQQMAQESLNTPVILMTGYGSELSAIEAFRLGAKDYLIKPFTVDEVIETINRALLETRLRYDKAELAEQLRRLKVEMNRQTHEMNTLFKIGKAITSLLSVDLVLERVEEAARYLTDAEESYIRLLDAAEDRLITYARPNLFEPQADVEAVQVESSYLQSVIRQGRPFRQSRFVNEGFQLETGQFARSLLCVPLKLRGVVIGVLEVRNQATLRSFSRRDEFLLSFLADYAAIALENARVLQAADQALAKKVEELRTLIDLTQTITSTRDLDEVIYLTIKQIHQSWQVEAASLWWLDAHTQRLRVLRNIGTPNDILAQLTIPLGEGFAGTVAQTGQWIYVNDVISHPLHYRRADHQTGFTTRSILCVPLEFRGEVVGVLQLINKQDGDFDDRDVERARSIAAAVAIAMTNALSINKAAIS